MTNPASLEHQVRRAAFGLAMLIVVTLGAVAMTTAIHSLSGNLAASQNASLKILAGNIQATLNRQIVSLYELSINPLVWPEFDTSEAHFGPTPSNGKAFQALSRQNPRYMDC